MDGPTPQAPFSEGGNLSAVISQLEENARGYSMYGGPGFLPQHFSDFPPADPPGPCLQ